MVLSAVLSHEYMYAKLDTTTARFQKNHQKQTSRLKIAQKMKVQNSEQALRDFLGVMALAGAIRNHLVNCFDASELINRGLGRRRHSPINY